MYTYEDSIMKPAKRSFVLFTTVGLFFNCFIIILLLHWGFIVIFTKVLTIYLS
jgi:hypothetical protein